MGEIGRLLEGVGSARALDGDPSNVSSSSDSTLEGELWGSLPNEIVEIIRAFLPPSASFRFRCVCKRWNSLCTDPGFSKLYSKITPPVVPSVFILTHDAHNKRVGAFYLELCKLFQLPFDFLPREASVPLAEAGGLLCVGSLESGNSVLWVCNPLTRSWKSLPDCGLQDVCKGGETPLVNMMIEADTAAYKVVVIGDPSLNNHNFSTILKVYHSEKGLWTHHLHKLKVRSNLPSTSVIRDGVLYWCTMSPDGLNAYNLENGACSHRRVSFPRLFTPFYHAYLFLVGGRLGLMGLKLGGQSFSIGLWTLEGEEDQARPAARWVVMPYSSLPALERQSLVNGFVQKSVVSLKRSDPKMSFQGNFMKGTWLPGVSFPDQDLQVQHIWCPYEPRLDISA